MRDPPETLTMLECRPPIKRCGIYHIFLALQEPLLPKKFDSFSKEVWANPFMHAAISKNILVVVNDRDLNQGFIEQFSEKRWRPIRD